ncbi:glycosyltransferase [candidate division WOR-3 bacterium]|uniref:Glycosyltransferase n=1 Tax=candidate division WOR-3 bacterium TaxID=2052148 RepID=A0A937XCW9_UNCW3|nr:glycosyltransferase [candidate division WOR-3 bacterium]
MMELMTHLAVLQWVALALAFYVLAVCLGNLLTMPRLGRYPSQPHYPRVSILVPARNEEENLPRLIPSLLAQDYPDFEVVVLDDNSTDRTAQILAQFARRDSRVRVLSGLPRPPGWVGKNWACQQLSEETSGDWILFTDADTVHAPGALRAAMDAALPGRLEFVSAIVGQEIRTWGERLVVPFYSIHHVFCTIPFELCRRLHLPISAANGQFMLFRRQAYDWIGGYASVRGEVLDDRAFAARVVAHGLNWCFCDAHRFVTCRMYKNWAGVVEGFTKGVFAAFDRALAPFALAWAGIVLLFFLPPAVLVLAGLGIALAPSQLPLALAGIAVPLCFLLLSGRRFGVPSYLAFLYPATVSLALFVAVRSVVMLSTGHATWKGRTIEAAGESGPNRALRPAPGLRTAALVFWFLDVGLTAIGYAYHRLRR